MEYKGQLYSKGGTIQVSDKFKKREFVLTDNHEKYPQFIQFTLTQDRCMILDDVQEGDEVTVHFGLKGRKWVNKDGDEKIFNTLDAFKVTKSSNSHIANHEFHDPTNGDLPF